MHRLILKIELKTNFYFFNSERRIRVHYIFLTLSLLFNLSAFGQHVISPNPILSSDKQNFTLITNESNLVVIESDEDILIPVNLVEDFLNAGNDVIVKSKKNIELTASITTDSKRKNKLHFICEENGNIHFSSQSKITSKHASLDILLKTMGSITIDDEVGMYSNGGDIRMQAFENSPKLKRFSTNSIAINGRIDASGYLGGKILIESDQIQVLSSAKVLSTGTYGGGKILIGGDWQGGTVAEKREAETMHEAVSVSISKGALIDASAQLHGNGGKVVIWSNILHPRSNTEVKGELLAMGGKYAGKGGMIETSGGAVNFENISVSTLAADGSAGEWLIDPWNFVFNSSQLTTLATNLNSNNVTISTGNSSVTNGSNPSVIFGSGHIVFQAALAYSGSSSRTLTLFSNEDIWINGNITSTGGGLNLEFNAPSGKRVLFDGDITTNGGSLTVNNAATVHFQKISGIQNINTNGGSINLGNSTVKLLRHSGSLVMNSGNGNLNLGGSGSVEQVNTSFQIITNTQLYTGWGGAHVNSLKDYGVNIVAGREYSTRLYFWDSWDNERGELVVFSGGTWQYYFTAHRTHGSGGNEMSNIVSNFGTQYQIVGPSALGGSSWTDVYVDITFVAQHNGILRTWNNLNQGVDDESLEILNVWETQFPQTTYSSGSRSLELITTGGQISGGTKNFTDLASLTINTNNNLGFVDGVISGTTTFAKSGTGTFTLRANNTHSGASTIHAGTLVLQNNAPNPTNKTFNGTGEMRIEPISTSFSSVFSTLGWTFNTTLTGLAIGKTTNSANITTGGSAISIAGPITLFGGVVSTNANITTSNASSISLLARSGLRFSASGITLQTGGGAVVLSGDYDANSSGNIIAEGALTITTNGGAISMGGGATGSDFAYGIGTSSTIANDQTAGIWVRGAVNLNSGNGDISIRGYAANASPTLQHVPSWGVGLGLSAVYNTNPASVAISSGTGTILIEGFARNPSGSNTNSFGMVFNNWETTTTESLTITSANTTANAIRLIGNTQNTLQGQRTKNSLRFWSVNNNIRATGIGGGITLSGKTFDGNDHPQICWSGGNLLATSGPIVINTENEALEIGNDMYVGSRSGITGNTTSSSNVRFSIDDFTVASGIVRVASTGSLTIEPFGSSFTDYTPTTNTILGFTTASRWSLNENTQTLTGLTIGKPLNVSNITIGSTTTIAGPVTIYGGTLAINENMASSNGSTISLFGNSLTFGSTRTVTSSGQLVIAPQLESNSIDIAGTTGTLQLPASYFSTNFSDGFSNIQIGSNSQTGAISANTFTLRDNMSYLTSGSLTLGGKPVLGTNNVTLGSAISSISASTSGYFQTNGTGKVFRNVSNSSTLQFPLGNSSYNPVSITNNSGSADNFSVRVIDAVYLNGTSGSVVSTPVVNRTWDISKTNANAGSGVDIVYLWNTGEVINGSFSAPKMYHHTGSVWEMPAVTSTTFTTNMLTVVGYIGTFSPFTVAEGASALPVEMVYFYANCTEKDVELNWQTASEHNSDYFQLETSLDGVNWEMIQKIAAAGFSQELLNYSAIDLNAAREQKYYRLKQVDFNGEFALYGPLKADCAVESANISLHPNPCESHVTLSIDTQIPTEISYTIANPEGIVLETNKMAVQSGITVFTLDVSNYPSGMYILQFDMNDKRFIKKLTVQ